jgi:hypothetical protein
MADETRDRKWLNWATYGLAVGVAVAGFLVPGALPFALPAAVGLAGVATPRLSDLAFTRRKRRSEEAPSEKVERW